MGVSKPLIVGEVAACYTVLAITQMGATTAQRRYRVRANCCGREVELTEHSLKDARRRQQALCHHCARARANLSLLASYGYLERFGPVRVLARGPALRTWRVVWDCCGKESVIGQARLNQLKIGVATIDRVCQACALKRTRRTSSEPVVTVAAPVTVAPSPLLQPAGAELPSGVVSAASAWPRPGRVRP